MFLIIKIVCKTYIWHEEDRPIAFGQLSAIVVALQLGLKHACIAIELELHQ